METKILLVNLMNIKPKRMQFKQSLNRDLQMTNWNRKLYYLIRSVQEVCKAHLCTCKTMVLNSWASSILMTTPFVWEKRASCKQMVGYLVKISKMSWMINIFQILIQLTFLSSLNNTLLLNNYRMLTKINF